jgi:alpha-L-fucosidase 2
MLWPGHRHFSHLFPFSGTPKLAEACHKTLQKRLAGGGAHTGWPRARPICLYARLQDGEECLGHLEKMLSTSTLPGLFSNHPPTQIDGNFGACGVILEMLLQSHETIEDGLGRPKRVIRILPACPKSWLDQGGCSEDIRCRGGFGVKIVLKRVVSGQSTVQSQRREAAVVMLSDGRQLEVPPQESQWTLVQLHES